MVDVVLTLGEWVNFLSYFYNFTTFKIILKCKVKRNKKAQNRILAKTLGAEVFTTEVLSFSFISRLDLNSLPFCLSVHNPGIQLGATVLC